MAMVRGQKQRGFDVSRKSPALHAVMVGLWVMLAAGAAPAFWRTFVDLDSPLAKILFVPFIICLLLFWFYGVYHFTFLVFSYLPGSRLRADVQPLAGQASAGKIAVIYATFNDFNEGAILTCLNQDYPDYHVFIVDVSTNPVKKEEVDNFHRKFPLQTTLIRLQPRQGFKARSLNDALKTSVGEEYAFFAVCDADNYWPPDFLSKMVPYFNLDERIAFVQANNRSSKLATAAFPRDFEAAINASWYLHQLPRNKYGIPMCMGHGVIIRREAWAKVGGYPEIVQEDTAFTMRLRENGYYGVFAPDVSGEEEFPEDIRRHHRRQFRLVQADTEILLTQMPGFLRNKGISLLEKFDLLARAIRIPSQSLTLPFLALFMLIPLADRGSLFNVAIGAIASQQDGGTVTALSKPFFAAFSSMLSPLVISTTLLTGAAPLYPFLIYLRRNPLKFFGLWLRGITLHLSIVSLAFISLVAFILRGKAMFTVTGAAGSTAVETRPSGRIRGFLQQRLNAESPLIAILNIGVGLTLAYVGLTSGGVALIGIALIFLATPAIRRFGWDRQPMPVIIYLLPVAIIIGLIFGPTGFPGAQEQFLALAVLSVLLF